MYYLPMALRRLKRGPVDILKRAGAKVQTAAVGGNKTVRSTRGIPITTDILAEEISKDKMEMLVLPGGQPGGRPSL